MDTARLRQEYAAKLAEAKRLGEAFKGREHEMPQEAMDQISAALGAADEVKVKLELAQRMAGADAYLNAPEEAKAAFHGYRPSAPGEGDAAVDPKAWRSLKVGTVLGERELRYHVPLVTQDTKERKYSSAFEAYMRKGFADLGPTDRKTLSEGTDTAGGFLVPEDYQTELIKKLAVATAVRPLARTMTTGRDLVSFPRVNYTTDNQYTSGVRLTWTGELPAAATTARVTDPVFGKINIPVHTAMASMPISNDLIEDAVFDVQGYSSDLISEAFALGEDNVFINGTGVNQPMGILTEVDGNGPTSQASGTSAAIYTAADAHNGKRINDLYYNTPAQYRGRGVFVMTSLTLQAVEDLVDAQERPLIREMAIGNLGQGEPVMLKGKRIVVDEFVPEIAANSLSVIFGDWSGYLIIDRVGLSIQRLTEIYAETNLTVLLARRRLGAYCTEPYRFRVLKCAA